MLQYLLTPDVRYSAAELARMAIDGGCGWIVLSCRPDMTDEALRAEASAVTALCREAAIILTIENRPDIARELGLHGVYLSSGCGLSPAKVREELGAEAIIGVETADAGTIKALEAIDADYAVLSSALPPERCGEIIREAREGGATLPVVMSQPASPEAASFMMDCGASGILAGKAIQDADNPEEAIRRFLSATGATGK